MNKAIIPKKLYEQIHKTMPVPCVDIVIKYQNKILLSRRTNKPAQGMFWFPGGRIHKGEKNIEAAQRKVKEETGLKISKLKLVGVDETIFSDGPFGSPTHTVNILYSAETKSIKTLLKDSQHDEHIWIEKPTKNLHPYVRKYITLVQKDETNS